MFDRGWAAKVVIPKGAAENFLKEVALKKTDDIGMGNALSEHLVWWKPQKIIAKSRFMTGVGLLDLVISEEGDGIVAYVQFYTF